MQVLPQQVLAGRAGLGLSREEFAKRAQVSPHTVMNFELEIRKTHPAMMLAMKVALEAEGAVLLADGGVLLPGRVLREQKASNDMAMPMAESGAERRYPH